MRFPALLLLAALAAPVSAQPASLRVFPVRITLAPSRPIATLTVSNTSPVAVALQMGLVAWRQQDGQDRFEPTEQVLANPAIFKIEPGAQQVVRLGLRTPLDGKEGSYRLFLQELPNPSADNQEAVVTLLRLSVPVFTPAKTVAPHLSWKISSASDGKASLWVANDGDRHAQITAITLTAADGRPLFHQPMSLYV